MSEERVELQPLELKDDDAVVLRPGYPRAPAYPEGNPYGYGYGEEEDRGGAHVRELWRMVRKRKWLILAVAVVITTLVTIEAYRTKSTYRASAYIELGKDAPSVRSGPANMVINSDDDVFFPQLSINTHLFRLTSEPLVEDVVAKLHLDENPRFSQPARTSVLEAIEAIAHRAGLPRDDDDSNAAIEPDESTHRTSGQRSAQEKERLAPYVSIVSGGLQAEQVKDTRTLKVTFTHTDPNIAVAVANTVAQQFIETNFETKTEKFTNASDWLDRTTRELKAKVEKAEQDLANYTKENNMFSIEGKENLTTDKLTRLHDQATRAETERILKQSVYEEVKAGRVGQLPAAYSDPKLGTLQSKLEELEAAAATLSLKLGPQHPKMQDLAQQILVARQQIADNRKALEDRLKSEYEMAAREETSLKAALGRAKGEAVEQNQAAIQYNILKQEVDTDKSMYTDFLQKTSQAKLEVAQQQNNLRLVQPARYSGVPVGPNRYRMILMGLMMSLGAGVGLAYFLEYLDNTIKTVEDVGRFVRLPALGVIPAIGSSAPVGLKAARRVKRLTSGNGVRNGGHAGGRRADKSLVALDSRSSVAEAYRVVRTSMLLSAAGRPPKTILVTSGKAGEGKTTTVVNSAISLAQLGARVLIIDCDLRRPSTHKLFGVEHALGLSTYLSRDADVDLLIQKLQIPNLSLLPCGPIPPNPAELISSQKMRNLISAMSDEYDHVLIDSPPLINVTDPVILSSMVDGVILVVQGGKSTRAITQRARLELQTVGAKIFGVVLNNVDLAREGYDYYYYNRYYTNYGDKGSEATAD
jgi:succinoglycan biosynthesis transport protein ExoP